jgi:phosphoribosylformylglycinamidine synthase
MVGILDDFNTRMTLNFKQTGDHIFLVGQQQNDIASSEYLHKLKGVAYSPAPHFNLEEEFAVQSLITNLIKEKLIASAHDISEGGLAITLLESGFHSNLGFNVTAVKGIRKDAFWFGEAQSRVIVSVSPVQLEGFKHAAQAAKISITDLGTVTSGAITVNNNDWGTIIDWKNKYDTAIEKRLS